MWRALPAFSRVPAVLRGRRPVWSVPGGLQGAAGGCPKPRIGQGGQHGADPKARVLHPGGDIAHLSHAQSAGMLTNRDLDQHAVLGAGGTAAGRLVGQRVAHAIGHPLALDPLDRLDQVGVVAEDEVDLGCGQQPPGQLPLLRGRGGLVLLAPVQ